MKNYYQTLGLNMNAGADEIKRVFRQLAKRYHPDINQNNEIAAAKFREINEAYDTLGDANKKAQYDAELSAEYNKAQNMQYYNQAVRQTQHRQSNKANARGAYGPRFESDFDEQGYTQANRSAYHNSSFNIGYQQGYSQACQMAEGAQKIGYTKGYGKGYADAQNKDMETIQSLQLQINDLQKKNKEMSAMLNDYHNNSMQEAQVIIDEYRKNYEMERESFINELQKKAKGEIEKLSRESALRFQNYDEKIKELQREAEEENQRIKQREMQLKDINNKLMGQIKALNFQLDEQYKIVNEVTTQRDTAQEQLKKAAEEKEILRSTIAGWEEYGKTLEYTESVASEKEQWDLKEKNDKKIAKNTLYGLFGVYIWAWDSELKDSYIKLIKRYQKKADTDPKAKEKLAKLNEAYKILSDAQAREQYNESIGYTARQIDEERALRKKFEERMSNYESQKAEQEFWTYVEELMYNAQIGDAEAQNVLGEMYYYGDELEKDLDQAVYWFREAAKQRHPDALYNLGTCFLNGEGVPMDEVKGKGFIKQAEKCRAENDKEDQSKSQEEKHDEIEQEKVAEIKHKTKPMTSYPISADRI